MSIVKERIEESDTVKGKTISKILLLNKAYNNLLCDYTQTYLVITYYTTLGGDKIPYIYEAVFYEKDGDIAFTRYAMTSDVSWN